MPSPLVLCVAYLEPTALVLNDRQFVNRGVDGRFTDSYTRLPNICRHGMVSRTGRNGCGKKMVFDKAHDCDDDCRHFGVSEQVLP